MRMNYNTVKIFLIFLILLLPFDLYSYEVYSYFNSPQFNNELHEVIISFITQSQSNISMSAYSFDDSDIASALISAANRGVKIRITIDSDYWNSIVDILDSHPNIEVFNDFKTKGYKQGARQHHSKFIIFDYDVVSSPIKNTVITGSYNFSLSSRYDAYNNIVVVKDNPDIATMYIQEFNEEWGSADFDFNPQSSRMRREKRDPPPYFHTTDNFEVYFSYSDANKIGSRLIELLSSATNVFVCMYAISSNSIVFGTILNVLQSGKGVFGVFDGGQAFSPFSGASSLLQLSPNNFYIENDPRILHNKYIILNYSDDDPSGAVVITGSYNISENAEDNNDENVIIIKNNPTIARNYFKDFVYHFSRSGKVLEGINIVNVESTNINLMFGQNFSLRGENLHRVVGVFVTNSSYYSTITIISNTTNSLYLIPPNATGIFDLGMVLSSGDRFLVPVKVGVFDPSNVSIVVNDGSQSILASTKVYVEIFGYTNATTPYVSVLLNGLEKFVVLYPQDWYYVGSFYLDSLFSLKGISNNTPIVFKFVGDYATNYVTNFIVLPPPSIKVSAPKSLVKGATGKVRFVVDDPFKRKCRVSFDGNVNFVNFDDVSGELCFYAPESVDTAKIFYTIEDDVGYSFSDVVEVPVVGSQSVLVYPTFVKGGGKIYIEGDFEKIYIFDKDYNNVPFVLDRESDGRVFVLPKIAYDVSVLFVVIYGGDGRREVKKVVYYR